MATPESKVLELQRLASENDTSVTELLRKSLLVATKLKIADFKKWIESELQGYNRVGVEIPEYRRVTGELKAFNPYRGYIPMIFEDSGLSRRLSEAGIQNPIAELEEMAAKDTDLIINFTPEALKVLMRDMTEYSAMMARRFVPKNAITGILSVVRTTILQWALKLEEEGILGTGMTFSESEKAKAANSTTIHIQNFKGVLGDVSTQNLQLGDYNSIAPQLKEVGVSQDERNKLENILDELPNAVGAHKKSV